MAKKDFRQKKTKRSKKQQNQMNELSKKVAIEGHSAGVLHPTKGIKGMPKDRLTNRWKRRRGVPGKRKNIKSLK